MSLIKFNKRRSPWINDDISTWLDTDNFFADDFFMKESNLPAMNVKENESNFEIELAVPGFSKKEIEVTMEDDVLKICAEKSTKEIEENENGFIRKEFSYNSFNRTLKLPTSINQKKEVKANYKDGILRLNLVKEKEAQEHPKKVIEIA